MITKCEKCGGDTFDINESIVHRASLSKDSVLEVYKNRGNEIEKIICVECGDEYGGDDFSKINY